MAPLLHLLNRSGDADQRFLEPLPIAAARLELSWIGQAPAARALVRGVDLTCWLQDGVLHLDLPEIGRFEAIRLSNKFA